MSDIKSLTAKIKTFRDARDWKQFHTPRNLAESLVLETSEVLEHFQWKSDAEFVEHLKTHKEDFAHELADVLHYLLLLSESTDIDLEKAMLSKLKVSGQKYPVEKSKGKSTKYTKL